MKVKFIIVDIFDMNDCSLRSVKKSLKTEMTAEEYFKIALETKTLSCKDFWIEVKDTGYFDRKTNTRVFANCSLIKRER